MGQVPAPLPPPPPPPTIQKISWLCKATFFAHFERITFKTSIVLVSLLILRRSFQQCWWILVCYTAVFSVVTQRLCSRLHGYWLAAFYKSRTKTWTLHMAVFYQKRVLTFLFLLSLSLGFEGNAFRTYKTALREFLIINFKNKLKILFLKKIYIYKIKPYPLGYNVVVWLFQCPGCSRWAELLRLSFSYIHLVKQRQHLVNLYNFYLILML